MPYDPHRHHRRSVRLRAYDYAGPGMYFLTVCSYGRAALFGDVLRGDVVLNRCGQIVAEEWDRSAEIRSEIVLDEFAVMPNNVHGIVLFAGGEDGDGVLDAAPRGGPSGVPAEPGARRAPLRRMPRSLGSFVAGFKAATTRRINDLLGGEGMPVWQRNYHEHVIRNEAALCHIRNYIWTNPLRWQLDRENPDRWGDDDFDLWLQSSAAPAPGGPRPL